MTVQDVANKPAPRIGQYEIISKIGQGGIAEVYKGLQMSLQREVAIKVLSPDLAGDDEIVKRFERESLLIAKLNHPNIVHVIDKGIQGGRYYFVMEYVDGCDFRQVIYDPGVPLETKIEMLVQVCKALDFAHKNGVVHRDMKPANILVDKHGNALIADFGIAQLRDKTDVEQTSSDIVMGTVAYMSPEQKFSSANVDKTTDIYALGVILYEVCCGRKPEGRFRAPSELNPDVPRALDEIVNTCLAETVGERYQSASELKDDLLAAFSGSFYSSNGAQTAIARVESFMGKCRALDVIKESRYGSTYLVENKESHQLFIIKKRTRGDDGLREAKLLTSLRHKNIIAVVGAGGDARKTVVVTAYAPGGSLADRLTRRYGWKEAMQIVGQAAEGLEFAHKNNIIHGNLRPSNLLFDKDDTVKLTDFGLPPHYAPGKNWFTPPEKKKSKQGDIFATGVILHILLTGKLPEHDRSGSPYLAGLEQKIPTDICHLLSKMLEVRAVNRYQSFADVLCDYQEFLEDLNRPIVAPPPLPQEEERPQRRTLLYVLISGAVVIGVLLAVFWEQIF